MNSVCAAECGRECLALKGACTVDRLGGTFNMNNRVYERSGFEEKNAEVHQAIDEADEAVKAAAEAVRQLKLPETPRSTACYLACSRKCVLERCWARGVEVAADQ